jgi:hypothetical protein
MVLAVQTVRLDRRTGQLERAKINLNECREGRKADREAYERAQRQAQELNDAEVSRIVTEQDKINAETKSRYDRDLDRLRAGGLRKDLAAPPGSAGCSQASTDGKAAAGVDGPAAVCVLTEDLLRGAEVELRLLHLQNWIKEQLQVER